MHALHHVAGCEAVSRRRTGSRRRKNAVAAGSGVSVHGGELGRIFSGGDVSGAGVLSALLLWLEAAAVVGSRVAGSAIAAADPHHTCRFSSDLRRSSCDGDATARVAVVMDLCSKRIVRRSFSRSHDAELM